MSTELDIYRTAKLMISQHGGQAQIEAAIKDDALLDSGDVAGSATWRKVLAAIQELQRGRRSDEALN